MKASSDIINNLFEVLPSIREYHIPNLPLYNFMKKVSRKEIVTLYDDKESKKSNFGPFGDMVFPYHSMGAIDSLNLFDLDELIIFSFYWQNRKRYRRVLDLGANLGLHSIIMSKCGFHVTCYEPDSNHYDILMQNIGLNNIIDVEANNMAISNKDGEVEFVRVLGNTTGSHIAGSKTKPYGELERFKVQTKSFQSLVNKFDLIKMDVEGYEKIVIASTQKSDWENTDCILSVHDKENAAVLFEHFNMLGINTFSQKIGWEQVSKLDDMPMSHHEGSLFVTFKEKMFWQ